MVVLLRLALASFVSPQESDAAPPEVRSHDVSDLCAPSGENTIRFDLRPEPFLDPEIEGPDEWQLLYGDEMIEWIGRLIGSDDGDGSFDLQGDSLVVTAAPQVQERIARIVERLRAACLGRERVEIRLLAGAELPDAPMLLDAGESERRVRELVGSGAARVIRAGSTAPVDTMFSTIHDVSTGRFVLQYHAEISHGSLIHDPQTVELEHGLRASVRASRMRGATRLDLAVRGSEPAAPARAIDLRPRVWFASGIPHWLEHMSDPDVSGLTAALFDGEFPLRIECPRTRFLGFAGSFLVPDGKALWIPCRHATRTGATGAASLALEIRVHGPWRSAAIDLTDRAASGLPARLFQVGALGNEGFAAEGSLASAFRPGAGWTFLDSEGRSETDPTWWPSIVEAGRTRVSWLERMWETLKLDALNDGETDALAEASARLVTRNLLLVEAPPAILDRVEAALLESEPPPLPVELGLRVTRAGETIAQCRIPALTNTLATVWSGVDGTFLADWVTDVANEALIGSPETASFLDGYALRFVVRRSRTGRGQVSVDGMISSLAGPPQSVDLLSPFTPKFERIEALRLALEETRDFTLEDGRAVLRFGGEPLGLELSVRIDGEPPAVGRVLDLGPLLARRGPPVIGHDLGPPHSALNLTRESDEPEARRRVPVLDQDVILNLVDHFNWSGPSPVVRVAIEDGFLVVTPRETGSGASDQVKAAIDEIGRFLAFLEQGCLGEERLEVRVISGEGVLDLPLVMEAGDADRRVRELLESGRARVLRAGSTALADGITGRISQLAARLNVHEQEVEIAHGAAIFDPILNAREDGMTAAVRAARVRGGTWLDVAIRDSQPLGPPRELLPRPAIWLSTPLPLAPDVTGEIAPEARRASIFHEEVPLKIECAQSRIHGFAGSFLLESGKVLWIPCRLASGATSGSVALELRVVGPQRPAELVFDTRGAPAISLLHAGAFMSGGIEAPEIEEFALACMGGGEAYDAEEWWPTVVGLGSSDSDVSSRARQVFEGAGVDDESVLVRDSFTHFFLRAPEANRRRVEEGFARIGVPGRALEIAGRVTRQGETIAEFRLPATTGKPTTVFSGVDGSFLADWDVDVAGESMIGNPDMGPCFDGFTLQLTVRAAGDSRLQLVAAGVANSLDGPPERKEIANPFTPFVEQVTSQRLFISETRDLDVNGGAASTRFGGDGLALEVTVRLR